MSSPATPLIRARSTPAGLAVLESQGSWKLYPHLALLNRLWLELASRTILNAMVWMPPQHGKSLFSSAYAPAWHIGNFPDQRLLLASYAGDFAASWGRQTREIIEEHGPSTYGINVDPRSNSASWWHVQGRRGYMATAGVGGSMTGKQGHGFCIDDPVKDADQAASPTYRRRAGDWYSSVVRTRLAKRAWQIVTQTRWHEDDLSGRIRRRALETGTPWLILSLPAIAEEDETGETVVQHSVGYTMADPIVQRIVGKWKRKKGEALCEDLHPRAELEATAADIGSYFYAALYQQRPRPAGGLVFKQSDFRYWYWAEDKEGEIVLVRDPTELQFERVQASTLQRFITVDLAVSLKQTADWTVVSTWGITTKRQLLLLDRVRIRLEGPDQAPAIKAAYMKHRPYKISVESVAYQSSLVQQLMRDGLPVVGSVPKGDKMTRALFAASYTEAHNVFWPDNAPWLDEWETEHLNFPNGEHDDQVDTFSMAVTELSEEEDNTLVSW